MITSSIRDRIHELLLVVKRDFDAGLGALTVHPITGKPLRKNDLISPVPDGATERQLNSFSRRTGVALSTSLREWLKITNGAAGFYGVRPTPPGSDIETVWESYPDLRSRGWLPVARDDFGNIYVQPGCDVVCFVDVLRSTNAVAYVAASDMLYFALFYLEDRLGLHLDLAKSMGINLAFPKARLRRAAGSPAINPRPGNRKYMLLRNPELKLVQGLPFLWES
jgi:hypothetical protein